MMKFYTYLHRRADTNEVFYVGKGSERRAWSDHGRNAHWRNVAKKHGKIVEIVAYWETEAQCFEHEMILIDRFRKSGFELTNKTDGGEGASGWRHSEEARAKIAAAGIGRVKSEYAKRRVSEAQTGRPRSAEIRAKLSAMNKGRRHSEDAIAAMRLAHSKWDHKVVSDEVRAKIGAKHKGKTVSAESRAKIGAAFKGKPWSPARRAAQQNKQLNRGV